MTMKSQRRQRGSFCVNCCRMCNYRKIVTQTEQYEFNMKKIKEWEML